MFEEKVKTPPDSPPVTVIDLDDQPMWSNTRTVAPTPGSSIIQRPISNNFFIKRTHMPMIRENQFDGRIRSDPHRHIADFLEISNLFKYGENQEEEIEANERIKNKVVELESQINQGLRNRHAIIENLKRQFEFLEKEIFCTDSLPRTTNTKPGHEFVYKPPLIQNDNDKGDVEFIEEDKIKPTLIVPNPILIKSNSPIVPNFFKDCTVHIPYTNAKTFSDNVLLNHVGDKELKSMDDIGIGMLTKKELKKDDKAMSKEPNKEWKIKLRAH
ncbi:hypothetical protein Tco_0232000 [Tanacetum coccineum]